MPNTAAIITRVIFGIAGYTGLFYVVKK